MIEFVSKRPEHGRTVVTLRVSGDVTSEAIVKVAKAVTGDSMPFGYRLERVADLCLVHIYTD